MNESSQRTRVQTLSIGVDAVALGTATFVGSLLLLVLLISMTGS